VAVPAVHALPPLPPVGNDYVPPRVNGSISDQNTIGDIASSSGLGNVVRVAPQTGSMGAGSVNLDFADTDIREIAAQILGNSLHVSYSIDPSVHGTATLRTVTPLAERQLLPVLQSLLAQNGATLVQSHGIYRVLPTASAIGMEGGEGTAGMVMVPLRYAGAEDLVKALQPFAQNTVKLGMAPGANALLISGEPAQRDAMLGVIAAFDTDILAGQSYALLPVANGDAADFATAFASALHAQNGGPLASQIKTVPLARVNAVLLIASNPRYLTEARRLYSVIERGRRQTARTWHVYYLQNSTANDTAYILQQAFTPGNVTAQPTSRGTGQSGGNMQTGIGGGGSSGILGASGGSSGGIGGSSSSGAGGLGTGGGGIGGLSSGSGGIGGIGGSGGQGGLTSGSSASSAANPLLGGISNGGGSGSEGEAASANVMRIIPNPSNNALLVFATGEEEDAIEQMLHKVDILPLEVRIDATIAEVTLNDALQYGTQFFFKHGSVVAGNGQGGGTSSASSSTVTTAASSLTTNILTAGSNIVAVPSSGGLLGLAGSDGAAIISALQDVSTVKVLSAPELLVLDNETAQLSVGTSVPIQSGQISGLASGTAESVSSTSYQQTGVITQITPRVNSGGLVTLDIDQEVSSVEPQSGSITTVGSSINSPSFDTRAVKTRVVVQDGQTVGIAGLISDTASTSNSGLPFLRSIPILGAAFSSQNNSRNRTELLVLLTPHVLHDQRDARALTEDLREQMPRAAATVYDLKTMTLSGPSDPQAKYIK